MRAGAPIRSVFLAAALAGVLAASGHASTPLDSAKITVARGHIDGRAWSVRVGAAGYVGRQPIVCFRVTVAAPDSTGGGNCSSVLLTRPPHAPANWPYGVDLATMSSCAHLAVGGFAYGEVVASARSVTITLSTGKAVRVKTIAPGGDFPRSMRVYVATFPCDAAPRSVVARDAGGRIVGRRSITFFGGPPPPPPPPSSLNVA